MRRRGWEGSSGTRPASAAMSATSPWWTSSTSSRMRGSTAVGTTPSSSDRAVPPVIRWAPGEEMLWAPLCCRYVLLCSTGSCKRVRMGQRNSLPAPQRSPRPPQSTKKHVLGGVFCGWVLTGRFVCSLPADLLGRVHRGRGPALAPGALLLPGVRRAAVRAALRDAERPALLPQLLRQPLCRAVPGLRGAHRYGRAAGGTGGRLWETPVPSPAIPS